MDFTSWKWLNESQLINKNGELVIYAPGKTDWFNNPIPENAAKYAGLFAEYKRIARTLSNVYSKS